MIACSTFDTVRVWKAFGPSLYTLSSSESNEKVSSREECAGTNEVDDNSTGQHRNNGRLQVSVISRTCQSIDFT